MKLSLKALAVAAGLLWGGAVLCCGIANAIWPPYAMAFLHLVASIYPGYDPAGGAGSIVVGTLYAILDGAVGGLLFAWLYNCLAGSGPRQPVEGGSADRAVQGPGDSRPPR